MRKLITYPDDKLSIKRYICYLEQFDSWFMHAQQIMQNATERGFPERVLIETPLDTVQAEIYLQQHSMSAEQLQYAIDSGFKYNKRIVVTHLTTAMIKDSCNYEPPESLEVYKFEYPSLSKIAAFFQVPNDKEFLKCLASFEGSYQN